MPAESQKNLLHQNCGALFINEFHCFLDYHQARMVEWLWTCSCGATGNFFLKHQPSTPSNRNMDDLGEGLTTRYAIVYGKLI